MRMYYSRLRRAEHSEFKPGGKAGAGARSRAEHRPYRPVGKCQAVHAGFRAYTAKQQRASSKGMAALNRVVHCSGGYPVESGKGKEMEVCHLLSLACDCPFPDGIYSFYVADTDLSSVCMDFLCGTGHAFAGCLLVYAGQGKGSVLLFVQRLFVDTYPILQYYRFQPYDKQYIG